MDKRYHDKLTKKRFKHKLNRKDKLYELNKIRPAHMLNILEYLLPIKRTKISMPNDFSLTENINKTMDFFETLLDTAKKKEPIFIDSLNVISISPDAILYLILIIEEIHKFPIYNLRGNSPSNSICKKMLRESGFLSYVRSPLNKYKTTTDILTIREGTQTEPKTAQEVLQYVKKYLKIKKRNKNTKAIYSLIIEAMANTYNHATQVGKEKKKWYLMAYYTEEGDVQFAFLDNGITIPKTIRKNFKEILASLIGRDNAQDHELMMSAFHGSFRTQTKERKRGKGLPKMYELATDGYIKDLVIISNKGYVNANNGKSHNLRERFHGTLISWKATTRIGE